MVAFIFSSFFVFLFLSLPIGVMLLLVTGLTLEFFTSAPLTILPQQIFSALDSFVLQSVPLFILAGNIMSEGAIARKLIEVMNALVGSVHGGLAIASVMACMFFAAISGSSPATVIAIGSIMMPALIKMGYGKRFSIGLLTSAGSLGILIPPSIPMVLYCLVMDVSVGKLFMAGFLPGIFIGLVLIGYSYFMSRRYNWKHKTYYTWRQRVDTIKSGIWGIMLPVIVLGGIYGGIFTPTEAAAVSVIYSILVELFIYKELEFSKFSKILRDSSILAACLLFIISSAMTFVWLLTSEELTVRAADFITNMVGNKYAFLLLINILLLIVGCFMDIVSAIVVISPILLITLNRYNIDLIHFGIIMIINMECGFITPPFGLNLFVSMGVLKETLQEVGRSVLPFIILFIICLFAITYVPTLSLLLPKLLLR